MNILLSGDNRMYVGMELVIYSLLQHNKNVNIYVFTMDIEVARPDGCVVVYHKLGDWERNKLRAIVKIHDKNSNICFIDTKKFYMEYFNEGPNHISGFSPFAPLRLLADVILPYVNDILYLDADTAVTGDISHIYNEYLTRDADYSAYFAPNACDGNGEMVSGVMLLNLAHIRKTGFLKNARRNYMLRKYTYPDQDALRDAGTAERFPDTMGYCEDLYEFKGTPLIIHFTNKIGPKIYDEHTSREYFYTKYPFLKYVKDGVEAMDNYNFSLNGPSK